ncbi:MAG: amidohydrolase, partial [Bacteroidota bacterium]
MKKVILFLCLLGSIGAFAQGSFQEVVHEKANAIEERVIEWRRYFHENPELSNREFKTAKMIAAHLEGLGIEVQREVALTGVVGLLRGGKPGKTVALRADMDALPVTERVDIPFASKVRTTFLGTETG